MYEYEQPTWQAYLQSINDALTTPPATASPAASDLLADMMNAAGAPLPSTTLQGAGNSMFPPAWQPPNQILMVRERQWAAGEPERIGGYGEQCADTDGMAADNPLANLARGSLARTAELEAKYIALRAECTKLVERCVQAEVNLARANQERDALRTELAQRMAIPARALRP